MTSLPRLKLWRTELRDDIFWRLIQAYSCSGDPIGRQSHSEIQTFHNGSIAHPLTRAIRKSRWWLILVQRLAHAGDHLRKYARTIGRAVQRSNCRYRQLERTL